MRCAELVEVYREYRV